MARTMVKAMGASPRVQVTAVASRSQERAESFAREHQIEHSFGDVPSLATCPDVDVVYVASHPSRHVEDCLAALETGKPVLCEKPLATSVADAELLADTASKRGVFLMEGMWLRFLPAVRHAERLIHDGVVGAPLLFQADFGYPVAPGTASSGAGVGVLLDRAVYPISLAIFFLGKVRESSSQITRDQYGVASQASFVLRHDGGALSQLSVSSEALLSNRAVVCCQHGRIELAEPLLGTERVVVRQHRPVATTRATNAAPTSRQRVVETLKSSAFLRKLRARYTSSGTASHLTYGPSPYVPQLEAVVGCLERRETQCTVMPLAQTIEALRVIEQSQNERRKTEGPS
jgi:predicted dehydrogenase